MSDRVPSYRRHKSSGQAVVTLPDGLGSRRDVLLGKYGTADSRREYARVLGEWEANGRRPPARNSSAPDLTVNELYWRHAEAYYVKDGRPTSEQHVIKGALRYVKQLYGHTPARDFGPLSLKAVRAKWVAHRIVRAVKVTDPEAGAIHEEEKLLAVGLARRNINKMVGRIKRMFAWAVENELLPAEVHAALQRVQGLRKGKGEGREKARIKPVPVETVEETLPYLPPVVQAMVEVHRLTGMRPQEVCGMRPVDIDATGAIWEYRPPRYKTEHRNDAADPDRERIVFIGPKAQAILKPFLPLNVEAHLFSPTRGEEERNAKRRQERKSPLTPSQAKRRRKASRRRRWRDCYDVPAYRRAISRRR